MRREVLLPSEAKNASEEGPHAEGLVLVLEVRHVTWMLLLLRLNGDLDVIHECDDGGNASLLRLASWLFGRHKMNRSRFLFGTMYSVFSLLFGRLPDSIPI